VADTIWPGDLAAQERYGLLIRALGGEPESGHAKAVIARLVSWTDRDDIEVLAGLIRHRVHEIEDRYKPVVEQVAPIARASNETSDSGDVVIAISTDLAHQIIIAAGSRT
jgi:hypothetical protein